MKVKASEAVIGQWYESESGERLLCVGNGLTEDSVCYAVLNRSGKYTQCVYSNGSWKLTHLPDCTGWDWKPEPKSTLHEVDPGEGWRLLDPSEVVREYDEWWDNRWLKWRDAQCYGSKASTRIYRRRIEPKYRPFRSFVEFIERGGHERWISVGGVYRKPSCLRAKEQFVSIGGGYITLEELFQRCKFIDPLTGETEPCGVLEE